MSEDHPILSERRGETDGILWLTLNRPHKLNALTFPLLEEMREILFQARFDRTVRCIVITGAGRGFCAGMDFSGAANPNPDPKPEGLEEAGTADIEGYRLNFRHETETYIALRTNGGADHCHGKRSLRRCWIRSCQSLRSCCHFDGSYDFRSPM